MNLEERMDKKLLEQDKNLEQWKNETNGAIDKDPKLLAKYLNNPDNKYFKTAPTKL